MAIALHLRHFRFGKDDGTESTHTFYANEDTATPIVPGATFLLRIGIQEEGGSAAANLAHQFQYNKNGAGWNNITTTSSVAKAVTPASFANNANSTTRLSLTGSNDSTNSNCTTDGSSGGINNDVPASGHSETVCAIQLVSADVAAGDTIQFRVTVSGPTTTLTVDATPSLTVMIWPIVTTQDASSVADTTATGNGNITDIGGVNCIQRGIVYGTTSFPDPVPANFVVCQNFEGTGYDNGETWIEGTDGAGSGYIIDPNYVTSPLRGVQSLHMKDGTVPTYDANNFSAHSSVYGSLIFKLLDPPDSLDKNDVTSVFSDVSGGSPLGLGAILLNSNRTLEITHANYSTMAFRNVTGSTVLSLNTIYYIWFYWAKGTGSNGQMWLKISTTPVEPAEKEAEISDGYGIADVVYAQISTFHGAAYEYVVDQMLVKTSAIGNVPPANVAPASSGYDSYAEDTGDYSTGAFTKGLTGLSASTTYYARAYTQNPAGYNYGPEISFTTGEAGGETRNLLANAAGSSTTSNISATSSRALLSAAAGSSSTQNIAATLARALLANAAGQSATSDISASLTALINLVAAISGASVTSEITRDISRALTASVAGGSVTPNLISAISRALATNISGASSTPDSAATLIRNLLSGIGAGSLTSDIAVLFSRRILASIQGTSATSDLATTTSRSLLAALSGASLTPEIAVTVERALVASVLASSTTPDITITASVVLELIAAITGSTETADIAVTTARALLANIEAGSQTGDALSETVRNLLAGIAVSSTTPDIISTFGNLITFSAAVAGVSITSDLAVNIARTLSAIVSAQSATPDLLASVSRMLLADVAGTSITPDDLALIFGGIGIILDPTITSITPVRTMQSLTPIRTIESM